VAGHEDLDFVGVVRIHDRQLVVLPMAVGLAAGHEALDFVSVVRIHDRQLRKLEMQKMMQDGVNEVYQTHFKVLYPAQTIVTLIELPPEALTEIEMAAKK
jgi:hypothetical protein